VTAPVPAATAFGGWAGTWFVGQLLGTAVVLSAVADPDVTPPTWVLAAAAACTWVPFVVLLHRLGRSYGTGDLRTDYAARWRPVDLLGVPIGVAVQVLVGVVVYAPLRALWPDTFGQEQLEENVGKLTGQATAGWAVLLVVIVVIGAPLIEEFVYRGLLQGAAVRRFGAPVAVPGVAVLFALVHFRPVEYPGLLVFGLVVGVSAWRTGRLGMPVLIHVAFNATGLALAWR
jgi:membrane protease YdiL (CAAX protease family)